MSRKLFILVTLAGPIVFLDQLTKFFVVRFFHLHESMVVVEGFFSLTYIRNPGAAFGLFAGQSGGFRTLFFFGVSLLALLLLTYFLVKVPKNDSISLIAISLLFSGAVGNLSDRIRLGEVVDFLDFYVGSYHWPAFNVADSAITIGVSLLLFDTLFQRKVQTEMGRVSTGKPKEEN